MEPLALSSPAPSPAKRDLEDVLMVVLPTLSCLVIPPTILNFVILLKLDAFRQASHFIYLNLVFLDALTALVGILITFDLNSGNDDIWRIYGSSLYLVTFDAQIALLFGLSIIRLLALKMSPSTLALGSVLIKIAYGVVAAAWAVGVGLAILPHVYKARSIWPVYVMIDLGEVMLITATGVILSYIWIMIKFSGQTNTPVFRRASRTSSLLFSSFALSYTYYLFLNVMRIQLLLRDKGCPTGWLGLVVCTDNLYIGLTFMLLQSLCSNAILIAQDQVWQYLKLKVSSYRTWIRSCCGTSHDGYDSLPYV